MADSAFRRTPTGASRLLFRLPVHLYRIGLGWLFGRRLLLLNHIGRVSGKKRRVVVEVVERDPDAGTYTVCSGFGPKAAWYRNLMATPDVTIQVGVRTAEVTAVPLPPEEAGEVLVRYARRRPRTARGLTRFMGFETDGSEAAYRRAGTALPFVRFVPRT
ncbi:nitroreductase family deazaflavin-dependent oxidoreductase [Thermobifida halotolerans]|uniref:Nitroreductase family deazaflavin-dependent oxidoreductase n=2 Tax=Thermobifida halotolerans TaxID=483545 RepID=A0A399G6D0_9ACTN|nr:nitroreductase family deazaflavin-dependent oxidoreductase [Thermobifida halotolerans]